MKDLLKKLDNTNWDQISKSIQDMLKKEMHNGLISEIREKFEKNRQKELRELKKNFIKNINISKIDDQVNNYTNKIYKINKKIQDTINFDLVSVIEDDINEEYISKYPNTVELIKYISRPNKINFKLIAIFNYLVFSSTSQSSKSNAGNTGQEMVHTMLEAIGVKNYTSEFKSKSGSDTDFVFPKAKDVVDVEIYVAVQFSSNDRFRMVSGELKSGAQAFSITGNGMDASSKNLDNIGSKILYSMMEKNFKLVCYEKEIKRKITELEKLLKKTKKDGSKFKNHKDNEVKLKYYKNYTISFKEFAEILKKRF